MSLGPEATDLIEGEREVVAVLFTRDYPEHRRTPSCQRVNADTPISDRPEGTPRPSPGPASKLSFIPRKLALLYDPVEWSDSDGLYEIEQGLPVERHGIPSLEGRSRHVIP